MSPARQQIWFIVIGAVLLVALVGARVTGGLGGGGASRGGPAQLPEQGASVGDPAESGAPGGASPWEGGDEDGMLGDTDQELEVVPMALILELIGTMRMADIPPVMPSDVEVEYVDGYTAIVVRGEFENTSATEARFEWRDGTWHLVEPTGPE